MARVRYPGQRFLVNLESRAVSPGQAPVLPCLGLVFLPSAGPDDYAESLAPARSSKGPRQGRGAVGAFFRALWGRP